MKKVCEYIDNNFKLCLVFFAVVFGVASLTHPIPAYSITGLLSTFGMLLSMIIYADLFFSNQYLYCFFISLLILVIFYIAFGLSLKQKNKKIKYSLLLQCISSIVMLVLTIFEFILYAILNSDSYTIVILSDYIPSLLCFTFCTVFSTYYCFYKFHKTSKTKKPSKQQQIDDLKQQLQDLQQQVNNNEKTE